MSDEEVTYSAFHDTYSAAADDRQMFPTWSSIARRPNGFDEKLIDLIVASR
jgi:hypothetical protein